MKNLRKNLPHTFDITKQSGNWLCSEDKELYRNQIESGGRVGYTTKKVASISTIHPSKRPRSSSELSTNQVQDFSSSTNTEEDKSCTDSDVAEESSTLKRKYKRTKSAAKLVSKVSLSTRKASNVLENLAEEELDVTRPSQSGIWRRVIKDVDKVKARLKNLIINEEEFCLNFDWKRIDNKEYQVVCLRNSTRTLNLGVLTCDSGSAENIFIPLQALLDEYNAWRSVKLIISDTTAVNTGHRNGVVARLQRQF